jgi:hypothetical protein
MGEEWTGPKRTVICVRQGGRKTTKRSVESEVEKVADMFGMLEKENRTRGFREMQWHSC